MKSYRFALVSLFSVFSSLAMANDPTAGQVFLSLSGKESAKLPRCGGEVRISESDNNSGEQLNIVVKGSENCSRIQLVKVNKNKGQAAGLNENAEKFTDGKIVRMSGGANGPFSTSVTISKTQIANTPQENDINRFVLVVESGGEHKTQDFITVEFKARGFDHRNEPVEKKYNNVPSSGGGW